LQKIDKGRTSWLNEDPNLNSLRQGLRSDPKDKSDLREVRCPSLGTHIKGRKQTDSVKALIPPQCNLKIEYASDKAIEMQAKLLKTISLTDGQVQDTKTVRHL
jgi:hypothetical protein